MKLCGRKVKCCFHGTFPSLEFPATCPVAMVTMSGCTLRLCKRKYRLWLYSNIFLTPLQASLLKMMSGSTVDVKQLIQAQTMKVKSIFENIKTQNVVTSGDIFRKCHHLQLFPWRTLQLQQFIDHQLWTFNQSFLKQKISNVCCFQLLKCEDLWLFSVINEKSLGFGLLVGLIKIFEDVTLDFGKLWWAFVTVFWYLIELNNL